MPYLHQHLVANLPARPPDAIEEAAAEDCEAEEAEATDAAAAAVAGSSGSSGPTLAGALLFVSDAAHAAAAVDSLQRHHTRQLASRAREQPRCRGLVVQPCVADGLTPAETATITSHLRAMPCVFEPQAVAPEEQSSVTRIDGAGLAAAHPETTF